MIRFLFLILAVFVGLAPTAYADDDCNVPCPVLGGDVSSATIQMESELQTLRTQMEAVNSRLGKPGTTTKAINELRAKIDDLQRQIDELKKLDPRLKFVEGELARVAVEIDSLRIEFNGLRDRVWDLEQGQQVQNDRLDSLEAREKYLPIGFVGAGGLTLRTPMTTGDGTPLTGPMLGLGGAGLRLRHDPREAGTSYVGALGLGFYEFQKSAGFLAAGELGFHPGPGAHFEIGLMAGVEGHFIQALDSRLTGHTAYSMGAIVGPHLGFNLGDGWGNFSIDAPVMFGQAKSATSSSKLWIEGTLLGSWTISVPNPKFKRKVVTVSETKTSHTSTEGNATVEVIEE